MEKFERLEKCFFRGIFLTPNGRQHSKSSEERPIELSFAQHSCNIPSDWRRVI